MLNELNNFVYENHRGERFYGMENGVYLCGSDILDYSWNFDTINNRISRFYRSIKSRKLPLVIACKYEVEAIRVKNLLCELAEIDIEAGIPGKIFIGDYYTTGFITSSTKSKYLLNKRFCKIDLVLTSHDPSWYREHTHVFTPGSSTAVGVGIGTDCPYDYPYDYAPSANGRIIESNSIKSNKFRLKIYGKAVNPTVIIGGHVYAVNTTVDKDETLLIDSTNKTIVLTKATGNTINLFMKRNRESYIFEPIPTGRISVISNGTFAFDLTVIEERSEPKWT